MQQSQKILRITATNKLSDNHEIVGELLAKVQNSKMCDSLKVNGCLVIIKIETTVSKIDKILLYELVQTAKVTDAAIIIRTSNPTIIDHLQQFGFLLKQFQDNSNSYLGIFVPTKEIDETSVMGAITPYQKFE